MKTLAGYSDKISVLPGETISFYVSSEDDAPYEAQLLRIQHGDLHPDGPGYLAKSEPASFSGQHAGRKQHIRAGSYAAVPDADPLQTLDSFTFQAIIWPTAIAAGAQTLIGHWDGKSGAQLLIDEHGAAALRVGDGERIATVSSSAQLDGRQWYFVAGSYDAARGEIRIVQRRLRGRHADPAIGAQMDARFRPAAGAPLTIAALQESGAPPRFHYNGKLEAPRIFRAALDADAAWAATCSEVALIRDDLVAAWDFSRNMESEWLDDLSPHQMHARTTHMPGRGMTGHNWTGEEMSWRQLPSHYGAVHFHDDDVYDAAWEVSFDWSVPSDIGSGIYCARLSNAAGEEFIPFAVRAPRGKRTSDLVFLMPTASYMAYGNEHVAMSHPAEILTTRVTVFRDHDMFLEAHPEYGHSLYDLHSDGSGVAHSSRLRPLLNMRPKVEGGPGTTGSSAWQMNADTHILHFLETQGFAFDVLTDEDLHHEGAAALAGYRCVITGSHPEYCSKEMLDALEAFTTGGGRLVYMGGNGFYWRIAYHRSAPGIIELRRAEDGIRTWYSAPGEYYHSFTGEYGGLWQRNGRPPQSLVGVGTTAQGFDASSYFKRTEQGRDPRAAFIFAGVSEDIIGDFGLIGGGAAGSEIDRADPALGTPPHALVVARSEQHSDAYLMVPEDIGTTTLSTGGKENPYIRADMVFFETDGGGAVFSASSIAWSGSLSHNGYDNNVAQITRNVLTRFIDEQPFAA